VSKIFEDTFNAEPGTALPSVAPATGTGWGTRSPDGSNLIVNPTNQARADGDAGSFPNNYALDQPATTEYTVEADIIAHTFNGDYLLINHHGLANARTGYEVQWLDGTIGMGRFVAGNADQNVSPKAVASAAGGSYTIRIKTTLADGTLTLTASVQQITDPSNAGQNGQYFDGTSWGDDPAPFLSFNDSSPLDTGYAVLGAYLGETATNSNGCHCTRFAVIDPTIDDSDPPPDPTTRRPLPWFPMRRRFR
jgi:hypothetical protein